MNDPHNHGRFCLGKILDFTQRFGEDRAISYLLDDLDKYLNLFEIKEPHKELEMAAIVSEVTRL